MTIELAVDNTNVEPFPGMNLADIRAMLVHVAGMIENGDFGKLANAILLLETDSGLETFHWGESNSAAESVGLLEFAKARIVREMIGGD